jgi:hypothetical protein
MISQNPPGPDGKYPGLPSGLSARLWISVVRCCAASRWTRCIGQTDSRPMAKLYEGDYEFGQAAQFEKSYREISKSIASPHVKEIADSFHRSIERVVSIKHMDAGADQAWGQATLFLKNTGKIFPSTFPA